MAIDNSEIKELVRERYGARAQRVIELSPVVEHGADQHTDSCGCDVSASCCGPEDMEHAMRLYNDGQLAGLPAESIAASAGCGNPTALAGLQPGERVLDLGSGGGIDCFLAAQQVGESGRVTGLDMTPSMLELARKNQASLGLTNVEFVQGELESMPLPGDSYDVIISNCVVCLSPDKDSVFSESFRVLAPGGRIHLSDVLALTPEGPAVTDAASWVACAAGAEYHEVYIDRMRSAGFEDIEINGEGVEFWDESDRVTYTNTASFKVTARKPV
jgi:SAM-dependent methyltransferase